MAKVFRFFLVLMVVILALPLVDTAPVSAQATVITFAPTNITHNSATLNGLLDLLGPNPPVTVSFLWGTTSGPPYPNETPPVSMTAPGPFSYNLTGLTPGTTYYFRAKAVDSQGNFSYGYEKSFTTPREPIKPPPPPPPPRRPPPVAPPAALSIIGMTCRPDYVQPNQPVVISVSVANNGRMPGSTTLDLYINGTLEQSQSVGVPPGSVADANFTVSKAQPGTYNVAVGDQRCKFVVVAPSVVAPGIDKWMIILLIIIALLLIAAIIIAIRLA